uniref:Uncharacterized protein n=1 Tax=Anopheles farauti TaxID=69004 RepID=A0A182QME7_9DIPT
MRSTYIDENKRIADAYPEGNHREANAATTMTTKRVTRFLPFFDSAERPPTELRHNRESIHMYKTLISISGTTYELSRNAMWKAGQEGLSFSRNPHVSISRSWPPIHGILVILVYRHRGHIQPVATSGSALSHSAAHPRRTVSQDVN